MNVSCLLDKVASFPVPRPAFRSLAVWVNEKLGRGTGYEAKIKHISIGLHQLCIVQCYHAGHVHDVIPSPTNTVEPQKYSILSVVELYYWIVIVSL